ncbi:hypothetical protein [Clostridium oceanicum]|uniref:Uncharacterized protein n=1 Tax=Clostridium oceanicum TaxID=1543 RepID=A0ABN1JJ82_9CLOT
MANYYDLTLKSVTPLASDTSKIEKVKVYVENASSPVTDLVQADFQLQDSSGSIDSANWTLDTTDATNGNYEIGFNSGNELLNTNYLITKIVKGANESDRLFVDFSQLFDSNGEATYQYNMTTPGEYSFVIDSADGETLNKASANYTFVNPPDATNSSIDPQFTKPYLVQVIPAGGLDVNLLVTLKDSSDNPLAGNSEVSLYANLI